MNEPIQADLEQDTLRRRVESLLALVLYCMDEACELNMDQAARFLDAASLSIIAPSTEVASSMRRDMESALSNSVPTN